MNLLVLSSFCWLWMKCVFGGCHTGTTDDQWLGILTSTDESWSSGATTSGVYGSIYTAGSWQGWRWLDNADCTDFQSGKVDYFDDFETIESRWEAIALYNCNTDAWLIESVYFWDGANQQLVQTWDPTVFGPFPQNCVYCNGATCGADSAYDLRLDNDYCPCTGVVFGTPTSGQQGTVWTGTSISPPDCSGEDGAVPPNPNNNPDPDNYAPASVVNDEMNKFAEKLLNYLMGTIALALILVVSALCLVGSVVRNKGSVTYDKVDVDVM